MFPSFHSSSHIQVPLFKDCDTAFLKNLALHTDTYLFTPGDVIVYEGDQGREMYFIRRGTCEVLEVEVSCSVHEICQTVRQNNWTFGDFLGDCDAIIADQKFKVQETKLKRKNWITKVYSDSILLRNNYYGAAVFF